jgi:hypothetical protein
MLPIVAEREDDPEGGGWATEVDGVEKLGENAVVEIKRLIPPMIPNNTIIPFADIIKFL